MLSDTLNTNEVKNAAGVEVEFQRLSANERSKVYAQVGENPALQHRLSISHQETGSGMKRRRRSVVRVDKSVMSGIDATVPITVSAYTVVDFPVGAMSAITEGTNVLAELMSFLATTGSGTTVLFDGTGNGASALLSGGL